MRFKFAKLKKKTLLQVKLQKLYNCNWKINDDYLIQIKIMIYM